MVLTSKGRVLKELFSVRFVTFSLCFALPEVNLSMALFHVGNLAEFLSRFFNISQEFIGNNPWLRGR